MLDFPKIEYNTLSDGTVEKMTIFHGKTSFKFLGDRYTATDLYSALTLKTYEESYHCKRKLVKDKYSRLFLYGYDEEMNFDGGPDRVDEVFVVVSDEADADGLADESGFGLSRIPYVYIDETHRGVAHEIIF